MRYIGKMTRKDFKKFEEDLKTQDRAGLEQSLVAEFADQTDAELIHFICQKRGEKIKKYKDHVDFEMREEIAKQLEFITKGEYAKVVEFLKRTPEIYSGKFLVESRKLLDYAVDIEDVRLLDYILKRRSEIYDELTSSPYGYMGLYQSPYVEKLLKLDAEKGLDDLAIQHIDSAIGLEYGDMIVQSKKNSADFYYHTRKSYVVMYDEFKMDIEQELIKK